MQVAESLTESLGLTAPASLRSWRGIPLPPVHSFSALALPTLNVKVKEEAGCGRWPGRDVCKLTFVFLSTAAMAAVNPTRALHEELFCPICLDYFSDPVVLNCDHNFCRVCITTFWGGQGTSFDCPQCRKRSRQAKLRPNTQLGKVAERAKELALAPAQLHAPADPASRAGSKPAAKEMCKKHQEALKLFCRDDQALICVVCDRSQEHRAHMVIPVEEAAEEYKVKQKMAGECELGNICSGSWIYSTVPIPAQWK